MRVGIIAALPREVSALVKGWEMRCPGGGVVVYSNGLAVVACAGMGAVRARLAVDAALATMAVTDLLSVGVAGACNPSLRAGDIVRAGVVIDGDGGEEFAALPDKQVLVSVHKVAGVLEKKRLHAACSADAVDMEAAAVARMAQERGLRFRAIKAISDESDFETESLSQFATEDGRFREAAFALHAALRPWMWSKTIALAMNSGKALSALTEALIVELDWYAGRAEGSLDGRE